MVLFIQYRNNAVVAMQVNSAIKCHGRLLFFVVSFLFAHQRVPQDLGGG